MKTKRYEGNDERKILTALVVDDVVLGRVATRWKVDGLFSSRWANLIGGWCVDYFARYATAPGSDIEGLFATWAERANDHETVDLVDSFLGNLSGAYDAEANDINPDYVMDLAGEHFNGVLLERMQDRVRGHLDRGDTAKALAAATTWDRVDLGVGAGVDVLQDRAAIQEAFESKAEPLIVYPGALGQFLGDQLGRDEFVAITGATGRGKTWWLMDIAWQAIRQNRRVAFFEVGDMSQNQILRRFMVRATGHPSKGPYEVQVPTMIARDDDQPLAEVVTETRTFDGPLNWPKAWETCLKATRRHKRPLLRLSVHPADTINVDGIRGILSVWEREGWVPDVIVVDYADILAAPTGYTPGDREGINATWKQLRGLSQTHHCLVLTATQGDAASYNAETISRSNFSDDRRKNDHVTGMLGINQKDEEKETGVMRLNWTKRREDGFSENRCVHVAGCLQIGRPHIRSTF